MVYISDIFNKNLPAGLYVNQFRDHHVEEGHKSVGTTWHPTSCNKSNIGRFFFINESKIPKLVSIMMKLLILQLSLKN